MKAKRILCGVIGLMYAVCTAVVPVSAADNAIPAEEELAAAANAIPDEEEELAAPANTITTEATTTATTAATESTTTSAATAATDATDERSEGDKIDHYLTKELLYDPRAVLESKKNLIAGEQKTKPEFFFAENGDLIVTYKEKGEEQLNFDTFSVITLGEDSRNIFPGSMVYADERLIAGDPRPIDLERAPIGITISNAPMKPDASCTRKYCPNSYSDAEAAISQIRGGFLLADNHDFPAQIYYKIEKIETKEQMTAKLNISESIWGKLGINVSAANKNNHSLYVAELNQIYYTVTADRAFPSKAFADNVTLEKVKSKITPEDAPAVVSSVSYGRKILVTVECDDSSLDIQAALDASFASLKANAGFTYNENYEHCNFKMLAYGGLSKDAGDFMTCNFDQLKQVFAETTKYKDGCAIQLCYTTRFLKDDEIAEIHYYGDRWNTVRSVARKGIKLEVGMNTDAKLVAPTASVNVRIFGKRANPDDPIDQYGNIQYKDKEELIADINISDPRTIESVIQGDVAPFSIRFEAKYTEQDPNNCGFVSLPLYELDENFESTRRFAVFVEGDYHQDEPWYNAVSLDFWANSDDPDYCRYGYLVCWDKAYLYVNDRVIPYVEQEPTIIPPETTATTENKTTVTTTSQSESANTVLTTESSASESTTTKTTETTPPPAANDILTTGTTVASSTTATTTMQTSETQKPDNWYASLEKFAEMALYDYEKKNGTRPFDASASVDENGMVVIQLSEIKNGYVSDIASYTIDPVTGKGKDSNENAVNLPQTGNNVPTAAAAAGAALLLAAGGFFAMMKSGILRRKKEQ